MTDLEELPEELDVTPSDDDGAEQHEHTPPAESEAGPDEGDAKGSGNRWRSLAERMGDTLHRKGESDESEDDESEGDESGDQDDGEGENKSEDSGQDAKSDAKSELKSDARAEDDEGPGKPRYEITDANGDRLELELTPGTKITFAADGRTVELSSMDQVVQLAQKGVAFDRVSSQQGQANSDLRRTVEALEAARKEDEELLLRIISDPDELARVAEALEKYQDPEFRRGQEAIRANEARAERDRQEGAAAQTQAVNDFWGAVSSAITSDLGKYEYLDADDVGQITQDYYAQYEAKLGELVQHYTAAAPQHGVSEDDAIRQAQADAAAVLNEQTLRQTMRTLNERYMKRAGRAPGGGDGKAEARGRTEAERHNAHVNAKRVQRDNSRSMRSGGGAPPALRSPLARTAPKTFEGKLAASMAKLRSLGQDDD